jgi:hypothetical protein
MSKCRATTKNGNGTPHRCGLERHSGRHQCAVKIGMHHCGARWVTGKPVRRRQQIVKIVCLALKANPWVKRRKPGPSVQERNGK